MAEPIEDRPKPVAPKPAPKPTPKPVATKTPEQIAAAKKKAAADAAKKKAAADAAAKKAAATDAAEKAANFGYSIAFFNSNPELKALLRQATDDGWSTGRFVAALQGTKWFRNSSESFRKYQALRASDPATYKQQLAAGQAHVLNVGLQMGAGVSAKWAGQIADTAMKMGWSDDQLKRYMMTQLSVDKKTGRYTTGQAAAAQREFKAIAEDYGITVSDSTISSYVRGAVLGGHDANTFKSYAQQLAASKYVALKDRIMAGESVRQIADPYIQTYGKILEVDAENLNLDDPLIQRALQAKDSKGKPTTQTLYDFEDTLRKDARWAKTDAAREQTMTTARGILQSFGLSS